MSRKPPKKTDMGKAWMKPRRDSRQMIFPEYHLIVSEGTKTEPKYFEKIRETLLSAYFPFFHDSCQPDMITARVSFSRTACASFPPEILPCPGRTLFFREHSVSPFRHI